MSAAHQSETNGKPVFYFDGPFRSRLFTEDDVQEICGLEDSMDARLFCLKHGFEFVDHRVARLPDAVRSAVLKARAAGLPSSPVARVHYASAVWERRPSPVTQRNKPHRSGGCWSLMEEFEEDDSGKMVLVATYRVRKVR